MEFNKIISFVLGAIVVILLLVWISNKLKSSQKLAPIGQVVATVTPRPTGTPWNPFGFLFKKTTPTPTPKQNVYGLYPSPTPRATSVIITPTRVPVTGVTEIPNAGLPAFVLPLVFSSFIGGTFLAKHKKQ